MADVDLDRRFHPCRFDEDGPEPARDPILDIGHRAGPVLRLSAPRDSTHEASVPPDRQVFNRDIAPGEISAGVGSIGWPLTHHGIDGATGPLGECQAIAGAYAIPPTSECRREASAIQWP
jgi:hypothetical protein